MNINATLQCDSCGESTNCRFGMSNREVQPLRFACHTCGQVIDVTFGSTSTSIEGAVQVETLAPFDSETNFVDLHLDFPVEVGNYVMGRTPFMRAAQRIGFKEIEIHRSRLQYLDDHREHRKTFEVLLKHYMRGKTTPFKLICKRKFNIDLASDRPEDVNAALHNLLVKMMWPFFLPDGIEESVDMFLTKIQEIHECSRLPLERFVTNIIDLGFLTKLQHDCLNIYPRILAAELALRPALFLDFDDYYRAAPIAMRVSIYNFEIHKDLYKDIAEIISRQFVLVAAVNNLLKRADHDAFLPRIGVTKSGKDFTPKNLDEFVKIGFGRKLDFVDDNWYEMQDDAADNQLRNAIAHFKTDYDDVSQTITYYPGRDGLEAKGAKVISFLEFMRRVLIAYREMHRLHHLTKALFYYKFLLIEADKNN